MNFIKKFSLPTERFLLWLLFPFLLLVSIMERKRETSTVTSLNALVSSLDDKAGAAEKESKDSRERIACLQGVVEEMTKALADLRKSAPVINVTNQIPPPTVRIVPETPAPLPPSTAHLLLPDVPIEELLDHARAAPLPTKKKK